MSGGGGRANGHPLRYGNQGVQGPARKQSIPERFPKDELSRVRSEVNRMTILSGWRARGRRYRLSARILSTSYLAVAPSTITAQETPYVVQSHIHGSHSEEWGTIRGHHNVAIATGVDVVWWTDHAERMEYLEHDSGASYDWTCTSCAAPCAAVDGTKCSTPFDPADTTLSAPIQVCSPWRCADPPAYTPLNKTLTRTVNLSWDEQAAQLNGLARAVEWDEEAGDTRPTDLDKWSFRIHGTTTNLAIYQTAYQTSGLFKRSLQSDVEIDLWVKPDVLDLDSWYIVQAELSRDHNDDTVRNKLVYYMNGLADPVLPRQPLPGETWTKLPITPGVWQKLTLPISADAISNYYQGNPEDANDQSLVEVSVAVRANSAGQEIDVYFDGLEVVDAIRSQPLFELQRARLDSLNAEGGPPWHWQGQEILPEKSTGVHVNVYGTSCLAHHDYPANFVDGTLCDSTDPTILWCLVDPLDGGCGTCMNGPDEGSCKPYFPQNISDWAEELRQTPRSEDVMLSYNHMFGFSLQLSSCHDQAKVDAAADELIAHGAYGVEAIEIGYLQRDLFISDFLRVWDKLGGHGLFVTGTGVTDSHVHTQDFVNPFAYVAWTDDADSDGTADESELIRAVRRGRVFFENVNSVPEEIELSNGKLLGRMDLQLQEQGQTTCLARMGQVLESPTAIQEYSAQLTYSGLSTEFGTAHRGRFYIYRFNGTTTPASESYEVVEFSPSTGGPLLFSADSGAFSAPAPGEIILIRAGIWRSTTLASEAPCCDNLDSEQSLGHDCPTGRPVTKNGEKYEVPVMFSNPVYIVPDGYAGIIPCDRAADCSLSENCT